MLGLTYSCPTFCKVYPQAPLKTPTYKRAGIAFIIISTGGFSTIIITTLEKHATTKN